MPVMRNVKTNEAYEARLSKLEADDAELEAV